MGLKKRKEKGEAKEALEHNSDISSKSSGKALTARAALEFLPRNFATEGIGSDVLECGRRFISTAVLHKAK